MTTGDKRAAMPSPDLPALRLVLLVAVAAGGCIGVGGGLPALPSAVPARSSATLSRPGRTALRALIEADEHPDLDWPKLGASRDGVRRVYASIRHGLAWSTGSTITPQARALAELLRDAERRGLEPRDYDGPAWAARLETLARREPPPSDVEWVRFDVAMTVSALRFVSDLRFGRTPRRAADPKTRTVDVASIVTRLLESEDVFRVVESLEPPFPEYRRTRAALAEYLERAGDDDGERLPVPDHPPAPGDVYAGAPRLARLLRAMGDLPRDAILFPDEQRFDAQLVDAVARFQRRHGLVPDGQLDARTVRALNVPLAHRVTQLKLTLERWRSLPRDRGLPEIVVNVPEFRLRAGGAEHALSMNVVVGRERDNETPAFFSELTEIVFRPSWNVPLSIQRRELVPRLRRNRGLLAAEGYEVVDAAGNPAEGAVSAATIRRLRAGTLRLRQRPGERNALGRAKFVVPNDFNVALHGTPREKQFAMPRRAFSHGCIRVEDPEALAAWALRDRADWDLERIRAALGGEQTVGVKLDRPIPTLVFYGTASVAEDGEVHFFKDVYRRDGRLDRALARRREIDDRLADAAARTRHAVNLSGLLASKVTAVGGGLAFLEGGGVRVLLPRGKIALGVAGYTSVRASAGTELATFRYGGLELAWFAWPEAPVHLVFGGLVGIASALREQPPAGRSTALVIEPRALAEAKITRSIRLAAGVTWRLSTCVRCADSLGARELAGPSAEVQLLFGRF